MGRAVVAVGFVAVGLGTAPAFLFGYLGPVLYTDLGISRGQLGLLVGLLFGATGLGSLPAGRVTERLGARWTIVTDMALLAFALALPVAVPGYPALVACALVSGFGYALVTVATNVAVIAALPPERHAVGLATKTAGVPGIAAVTSLLVPGIAVSVGWRPVLLCVIPVVALVALAAVLVVPDARRRGHRPADGGRRAPAVPLPPRFWRFTLAAVLLVGGSQAIYSWAVPFLHEDAGATLPVAGILTALASLVAVIPTIGAARLADRLGPARRVPLAAALCALTAVAEAALALGGAGVALAATGLVVATGAQLGAVSLMHASVVAAAPRAVGRATGMAMVGFYTGALFAAPLFGLIVDVTGSYGAAWAEGAVLTGLAAAGFWWCRGVGHPEVTTGPASLPTGRPAR
jgi:predicted MFS family arabinose efflux permease